MPVHVVVLSREQQAHVHVNAPTDATREDLTRLAYLAEDVKWRTVSWEVTNTEPVEDPEPEETPR